MTNTISLNDLDMSTVDASEQSMMAVPQILDKNWQTTAAVGLTVASGGVLGALSLAAFPAQTLAAGTSIGVLAYAGNRRANGETALPFMDKLQDSFTEGWKKGSKSEDKADA